LGSTTVCTLAAEWRMVPEPFSFMMMAAGLALVGVALRRSR
jgi:hypothetical protein